jgi:hypothetical protein
MSFGIPLYYASILFYLSPKYQLPILFDILLILAFVLEMLFIWVPARGKTAKVHTITALSVAVIMVFEMLFVALLGYDLNIILKTIAIIYFMLCLLLGILLLTNKKIQEKSFMLQSVFIFLFIIVFMLLQHI